MTHFKKVLENLESSKDGKGRAFEKAVKWWLQNDPIWSGQFVSDSVRLWEESPLRYGPDIGIDLTATDLRGGNWAIQVKNWDPNSALPKAELDSFLSASSSSEFVGRLLITTTNTISSNAKKTIQIQKVPCVVVNFGQLEASETWKDFTPGKVSKASIRKVERPLLQHQNEAVKAVKTHFENVGNRAQLIMACGSGKTLTGQRISESMKSEKTLILLPSLLLLQQTLLSWRQDRKNEFRFMAVCSDESVGKDEFSSSLVDLPFPVTTDIDTISQELNSNGPLVVFSTYQSSGKIAQALKGSSFTFDLVLADEAHRLAGISDGPYGTLLKPGMIPSRHYLFMTATPKVFGPRSKQAADESGAVLWSMDDENIFGKEAYSYSFARAISENRLTDYRVVVMGVTSAELKEKIEERVLAKHLSGSMDLLTLSTHLGLAKAMEKYEIRKVISFHSRVSKASEFSQVHGQIRKEYLKEPLASRPIFSTVLSGEDPANKRNFVLNKLGNTPSGEFGLVSNARCLTEGVDVPSLDGIAFIEPRSSQVDIVQAVGRAIRKSGDTKKIGYIVIPVFLSPEDIAAEKLNRSKFKPIWEVINALKAHDETLRLELDKLRLALGKENAISEFPEKIILDVPTSLPENIEKHLEAFILENTTESWEELFGKAYAFALQNGHLRINRETSEENSVLAHWITKQRTEYKKGRLAVQRAARLEDLPGWSWLPLDEMWLETFEILREYVSSTGSANPPATASFSFKGRPLGKWASKQRAHFKNDRLDANRIALLESLPGWLWDPYKDEWMIVFEAVREAAERLGHTSLPDSEKNPISQRPLNRWIINQRSKGPSLSPDKIKLLESLPGWSWNPSSERYEAGIALLKLFIGKHGHSRVPKDWPEQENVNLFSFVNSARGTYRSGEMIPERIAEFEALDGWAWNLTETGWSRNFNEYKEFCESFKRNPSRTSDELREKKLANWAKHQKELYRTGKLSPDKIRQLEAIDDWQWETADNWDEMYQDLLDFISTEGKNPQKGARGKRTNLRLDSWYSGQKKNLDKLSQERQSKLRSLPNFVPFTQVSQAWPRKIVEVQNFQKRNDRLPKYRSVDKHESTLGLWLTRQKALFENLSQEKRDALIALPGFIVMPSSDEAWEEKFTNLLAFVKANGGSLPTRRTDIGLASWLYRQSAKFHKLPVEQQRKLLTIPEFHRRTLGDSE